jgi:actin-related protein
MERSVVTNRDEMEKSWHYQFFSHLRACSRGYPVLFIERSMNPRMNCEGTTQVQFETFDVPSFALVNDGLL